MGKDDIEDIEIKVYRDQESQGKLKRDSWQKLWICVEAIGSVVWLRHQTVHPNLWSFFYSKTGAGKQRQSQPSLYLGEVMWLLLASGLWVFLSLESLDSKWMAHSNWVIWREFKKGTVAKIWEEYKETTSDTEVCWHQNVSCYLTER